MKMKKTCHSTIGEKNSAFRISAFAARQSAATARRRLHSAFLSGFTLLEIMIASVLFGLVVAGTLSVYIMCDKIWHATSISMQTVRESSLALSRLVYGLDTNSGLRAAGMVVLNTNVGGHPYVIVNKYWETAANPPPSATNTIHYVHVGCAYTPDGSWRLTFSNTYGGVKCIDYNIKQRNILFCPDTNQTAEARSKRILVCNYVSSAQVTTNASGTVGIQLTVEKRDGRFISSNTVSTSVKMRNKP